MRWRDYYGRFWKEIGREMVIFTNLTVIPSVVFGVFAAIGGGFFLRPTNTIATMGALGIGAVGAIAARIILAFAEVPVKLDEYRAQQIATKDSEVAARQESIKAAEDEIKRLHAAIAKPPRSPADEHYYHEAEMEIQPLSEPAKEILRHLHANERLYAGAGGLKVTGLHPDQIIKCLQGRTLLVEDRAEKRRVESRDEAMVGDPARIQGCIGRTIIPACHATTPRVTRITWSVKYIYTQSWLISARARHRRSWLVSVAAALRYAFNFWTPYQSRLG